MSKLTKALTAAAGNAGGTLGYVEDVFSTYLYTGTGTTVPTQSIDNGIDLDGEGGLVWIKNRQNQFYTHYLFDTERGVLNRLTTSSTGAESSLSGTVTSFNADGFTVGTRADVNEEDENFASWTFRKAEKFFDVVTYTGNDTSRSISHSLGSVPGCIIIKNVSSGGFDWVVYHRSPGATNFLKLNTTAAVATNATYFPSDPTSTVFNIGAGGLVNNGSDTYVAYLFASDAGGFGDDGSESIIKCGSFVPSGGNAVIDVGFEPQWLLVKAAGTTSNWVLQDSMRGWPYDGNSKYLRPNLSNAEDDLGQYSLRNNGFIAAGQADVQYIYIAIRRPMKTPESGTEVFMPTVDTTAVSLKSIDVGFPTDFALQAITEGGSTYASSRLTGNSWLVTNTTAAESAGDGTFYVKFDQQDIFSTRLSDQDNVFYNFKRATGFFDVVAYTGDGTATHNINHNLTVSPEMMIVKRRDSASNGDWYVYHKDKGYDRFAFLNDGSVGFFGSTTIYNAEPTSTVFTVGSNAGTNASGSTYIWYGFATTAGVSKVGSYTGTGSNVDVDCGFSAGARFILIKRSDDGVGGAGDWYVWDSERGIVAGNDPYLLLNSTAAEVTSTDYIDPLASGFTVTSTAPAALNASGGTYIFLAIS